jgi:para-nitrobenzyl esterase
VFTPITADPWSQYARGCREQPVERIAPGTLVVYGYQAASAALTDRAFTADHPIRSSRLAFGPTVLDMSGPDHERLRSVLGSGLRASKIAGYSNDVVLPVIEDCLDRLPTRGTFDLVELLTLPIPMMIICRLLGFDDRYAAQLCRMITPLVEMIDHGDVPLATARGAHEAIARLIQDELLERRSDPDTAPIGQALIEALDSGALSRRAVIDNIVLLLVAGTITASAALANATAYLLTADAAERERRMVDAEGGTFTREFLRLQPSVRYTPRFATTRMELNGVRVDRSEVLMVCLASANRDPLVFHDPDAWDTDRGSEPPPLSFGRGFHSCLGSLLGELELTATMARGIPLLNQLVLKDRSTDLMPGWTLRRRASLVVERPTVPPRRDRSSTRSEKGRTMASTDQEPIITLAQGMVLGRRDDRRPVVSYKGIPYASMSAERRFQPAGPAPRWSGVRDATKRGPAAVQPLFSSLLGPWSEAMGWEDEPFQSEDSLGLNVWAPIAPAPARPVVFFVHPGAFVVGSCDQSNHDGTALADIADVVVVACNYRLGPLGFLAVRCDDQEYQDSANLGLLDIVQALDWVHDNIAAFGGDPGNVTIAGSSAGAHAVLPILAHHRGRQLVHRASIQSASLSIKVAAEAQQQAQEFATSIGVEDASLEACRDLDLDTVRSGKSLGWNVSIDGRALHATHLESIAAGNIGDVPLMVGSTLHDGTLNILPTILNNPTLDDLPAALAGSLNGDPNEFVPVAEGYRELYPDLSTTELLKIGVTYGKFRHPFTEYLDSWSRQHRSPVYRYQFNWQSPIAGGLVGSCHSLDLPFWFGHANSPMVGSRPPQDLAMMMATALGAFARSGSPSCPELGDWPAYEEANRSTMVLDVESHVAGQDLYREQVIWDEFARAQGRVSAAS